MVGCLAGVFLMAALAVTILWLVQTAVDAVAPGPPAFYAIVRVLLAMAILFSTLRCLRHLSLLTGAWPGCS